MLSYTKTVVFADLLSPGADNEDSGGDVLEHKAHLMKIVEPYGGELVKSIGDSFLLVFNSATDGLKACIELVSAPVPGKEEFFRASVATGDIQLIGNDYFGEAVNLAARIHKNTPSGQVMFANRTRVCMNQSEIAWEAVGLKTFKGIAEKEMCYRAVHSNQCILGEEVESAIQRGSYLMIKQGAEPRILPRSGKNIFLVGYTFGSPELNDILLKLGQVASGNIWLVSFLMPTAERLQWLENGYRLTIAQEEVFLRTVEEYKKSFQTSNEFSNSTLMIDLDTLGDVTVGLVGIALPKVPMAGMIDGYSIDLLPDGSWGYVPSSAVVQLTMSVSRLQITPLKSGVLVNSVGGVPGVAVDLEAGSIFRVREGMYRYMDEVGSLYKGVIIGNASTQHQYNKGDEVVIGREPGEAGFLLPNRGGTDRIRWIHGSKSEGAKKKNFTFDIALTGRQHTKLSVVEKNKFVIEPLSEKVPTFLIRSGKTRLERIFEETEVVFGDLIVVGTHVLSLSKLF